MELEVGSFALADVLTGGVTMVRERATNHGITVYLDVDPTIRMIEGDERKVKQVPFNLLSNAVKFTPDGGSIAVAAGRGDDDAVQISVSDTGIGIAPEDQAGMFEEFHQVGIESHTKHEGTGLGLALAKHLVELHGGRIWSRARSEEEAHIPLRFLGYDSSAASSRRPSPIRRGKRKDVAR